MYEALEWFALGKNKCHANQITVSIDNLPKNPEQRPLMHPVFIYLRQLSHMTSERVGELHITMHSPSTIIPYMTLGSLIREELKDFDMISISSWDGGSFLGELCKITHINYNHLAPSVVNSGNIQKHIDYITEIGQHVSSIYMMTRKQPTSKIFTEQEELMNAARLQQDMSYIKTIIHKVPTDVRRKIHVDTCIQDVVEHSRTDFGCSANISKFQVWPDGTVSGCPYAFNGIGKIAEFAEDILENIRMARSIYEFKRCHIRRSHSYLSRR